MKKFVLAVSVVASMASVFANPIVAMFTGVVEQVQTASGTTAFRCEYDAVGRKFYKLFRTAGCPSTITVE